MSKHKITDCKRIIRATGYALQGLRAAWQTEAAFRQEIILCVILMPLALIFGNTNVEKALLIGSLFLVLIVELINSAIEVIIDRIGLEQHPLSGHAKDLGSGAVLISLLNAIIVCVMP